MILAFGVMIAFFYLAGLPGGFWHTSPSAQDQNAIEASLQSTISDVRSGRYHAAYAQGQAIATSSDSSDDQKALAELSIAGIPFRTTNDPQYLLAHIPIFKSVIADQNVSMSVRALAIDQLASSFCGSGRTWAVFQAIYTGTPYSSFLVPNDPDTSSRNMFTWSYQLYPTTGAAIFLARSYASLAYNATSSVDRADDISKSQTYLTSAESLVTEDEANTAIAYTQTQEYAEYLYWQAYTTAILAHFDKGSSYEKQYQQMYQNFITAYKGDGGLEYNYVAYAELLYGYFLTWNENDTTDAIIQFNAIEPEVKTDPYYNTDQFVRFVHNERTLRAQGILQGPFTAGVLKAEAISPNFAAFAASIP